MFCLSVKLLNIFYEVLETVYLDSRPQTNDCSASRDADVLGKALKLNHQLDQCLTPMPGRLGDFITNTPFTNFDPPCDFNLHEQALVTRYVISFLPELFLSRFYATIQTLISPGSCMPEFCSCAH
jgi:hypothetical protein